MGLMIAPMLLLAAVDVHREGKAPMQPGATAFGAIADCQYCDVVRTSGRRYALSNEKLASCVDALNQMDLAYTIHLGDFIDRDWKSFDVVGPIFERLQMPHYHVLGNHDFSVADHLKKDVPSQMGMPSNYYDFSQDGWRYVILDGNDVSFHAYPKKSSLLRPRSVNSNRYHEVRVYAK